MIVDCHNDLLTELEFRDPEPAPFGRYWAEQLRSGGVMLQVCPIYASRDRLPEGALRQGLKQAAAFHRAIREGDGALVEVSTSDDLADLADLDPARRLGLLLSMEGAEPLGSSPELMDVFWRLGVRIVALTWNDRNAFADGAGESSDGGLSRLGRSLVDRIVGLGGILDVAHASDRTFSQVLERSGGAPVICSHTGCRAVFDTPRNLSDDQLRALGERDGIIGMMAHPVSVDPAQPTIERYVDHILHAIEVAGVEHVGIGADFIRQVACSGAIPQRDLRLPSGASMADVIEHFEGPGDYPRLVATLKRRGITEADLYAVLAGNFLRLLSASLPKAA
jgi:membrane dipeptidase